MKLDKYDLDVLDKVEKLTLTDYDIKKYPMANEGYIESDNLIVLIEDLLTEIDTRDEKIEDLKRDINDNYRPISRAKQYEISDCDFI